MATVTLDKINKVYPNGFHAIHDLDLEIADTEFLVLVGPSGCGKSTALRMIAGLEEISGGEMRIGDNVVNDVEPKDRDIAMVFQNYALYPHMTVRDNIGFALKLAKTPKAEIDARVEEAARILELTEQLGKRPGQLSGGQRQRVAMGSDRAQPSAFLMDEPLSNLDAKLRADASRDRPPPARPRRHDRVRHPRPGGSHDHGRSRLCPQGRPPPADRHSQNLYDKPDNVFVAAFIGSPSMNLNEGTLAGTNLTLGSHTIELSADVFEKRPGLKEFDGRDIIVGIRPEDLEDASLAPEEKKGATIATTCTLTEALGSEIIVHFELDAPRADAGDLDAVDDLGEHAAVGRFDPRQAGDHRQRHGDRDQHRQSALLRSAEPDRHLVVGRRQPASHRQRIHPDVSGQR